MEELWLPGELRVELLLTGKETEGAMCVVADYPKAGWSLPLHRHLHEAETMYVVAGEFSFQVAGETVAAGPGDAVHVPAGVVHGGGLRGEEPGHRVLVFSPAGMEGFFRDAGNTSPTAAHELGHMLEVAFEYGWRFEQKTPGKFAP